MSKRIFSAFVLALFLIPLSLIAGNVFASYGGGMGSIGWGSNGPGFDFEGLYAVSQNSLRLTPNNEIYTISDYVNPINLWIDMDEIGAEDHYYLKTTYRYLDNNGDEIAVINNNDNVQSHLSHNSCNSYCSASIRLEARAATTEINYEIYNATINEYDSYVMGENLLNSFTLKFTYADYDSNKIPVINLLELRQGGEIIEPNEESGRYVFRLNNRQDYEVSLQGENIIAGNTYTYYRGNLTAQYDKTALENGIEITSSLMAYSNMPGNSNYSSVFGYQNTIFYQGKIATIVSDLSLNEGIPYYNTILRYNNSDKPISQASPSYNNTGFSGYDDFNFTTYDPATNPLVIDIKGAEYVSENAYSVNVEIKFAGTQITSDTFSATGLELNNGITKEYFDEIDYAKFSSLFDGTFGESSIDVTVKIGYLTETLGFSANGGTYMHYNFFSSDGLLLSSYNNSVSSGGGDLFVGYYQQNIPRNVFGDHFYLHLGSLYDYSDVDTANYYVYYHAGFDNVNDLSDATLVQSGTVNKNEDIGLIRLDNPYNGDNFTYTTVLVEGDRILNIYHHSFNLIETTDNFGLFPILKSDNDSLLAFGVNNYYVIGQEPAKLYLYGVNYPDDAPYSLSVDISSNGNHTYENTVEISNSDLDGATEIMTIPYEDFFSANSSYGYLTLKLTGQSGEVFSGNSLYLTEASSVLSTNGAIDYEALLLQIRELEALPASFSATLQADETFEDEFDAYLQVSDYVNLADNCGGICGIVGQLEYDNEKLELLSIDPLQDFEITEGNNIVLERSTGVPAGTNILKLHFKNKTMSDDEQTTIKFKNITGSDGNTDIATSDAVATITREIPLRYITSTIFTPEGHEIFARAGSSGPNLSGYISPADSQLLNANSQLIVYYDGYGFDENATYDYALKYSADGSEDKTTISSGTINGKTLNDGKLKLALTNSAEYTRPAYNLEISNGVETIFTNVNVISTTEDYTLYTLPQYGYSVASPVDGHHLVPYNDDLSVNLKSYFLDTEKDYIIYYIYNDYASCADVENGTRLDTVCVDDENAVGAKVQYNITVSGAELLNGYSLALPTPAETTVRRVVDFDVKPAENPEEYVNTSDGRVSIDFFKAEDVASDLGTYQANEEMVISKISTGTTASTVAGSLTLADGFTAKVTDQTGQPLENNVKVGTGAKIQIIDADNQIALEYTVKIKGDLSGDGEITVLDLVKAKRDLAGLTQVEGIFAQAGDIINNGIIGITDVVKICRHIAGLEEIAQ